MGHACLWMRWTRTVPLSQFEFHIMTIPSNNNSDSISPSISIIRPTQASLEKSLIGSSWTTRCGLRMLTFFSQLVALVAILMTHYLALELMNPGLTQIGTWMTNWLLLFYTALSRRPNGSFLTGSLALKLVGMHLQLDTSIKDLFDKSISCRRLWPSSSPMVRLSQSLLRKYVLQLTVFMTWVTSHVI